MSQQNVDDSSQMATVQQDQNKVAATEAGGPNADPQPAVFKLDTDCWDEVFDCLSLEDVHSFGQTCKAFQSVTGEYFHWKYVNEIIICKEDGIYINDKKINGFSNFVRKIWFYDDSINAKLRYVETKCKAEMEEFAFSLVHLNQMTIKSIEKRLEQINSLQLLRCKFNGDVWQTLFESCLSLKRLIFCDDSDASFTWPVRKQTTLEHLELYNVRSLHGNTLKDFLEHCPNLRSLEIYANMLLNSRDSICDANIDDLAIEMNVDADSIIMISVLNDVHQRGFYKRLHLKSEFTLPSADQLLSLPGLVTLYINPGKNPEYPILPNITELGISDWYGKNINTDALSNIFVNLEHLFISGSLDLLPFIRRSAKLRDVRIGGGIALDICALNKQREKMKDAQKVTIYVNEDVYLATKWASSDTSLELVELKRQTTRDIIRPQRFWEDFQ